MNWESLRELSDGGEWVSCNVIDSYTSSTHWYVRCELGPDTDYVWLPIDKIRRISPNSCEPSY